MTTYIIHPEGPSENDRIAALLLDRVERFTAIATMNEKEADRLRSEGCELLARQFDEQAASARAVVADPSAW